MSASALRMRCEDCLSMQELKHKSAGARAQIRQVQHMLQPQNEESEAARNVLSAAFRPEQAIAAALPA